MSESHHLACSCSFLIHALNNIEIETDEINQQFLMANNTYQNYYQFFLINYSYTTVDTFMIA